MISYKALKEEVTKYWKTSYEPNGTAVGGTFDADRQTYTIPVGGKGHIETPGVPPLSTADYWEITVAFTYQGSAGSYPCLFGYSGGVDYKSPCLTYESGNYRLYLSFNGTTWDFVGNTGIAPQVGSTYKFNVRFTGVAYVVRCSVNGGSFTEVLRYSSSTPVYCSTPLWFMDLSLNNNYATYGDLKLYDTYIFIDTDYWWEGVKETRIPATPEDYDITTTETEYKVAAETTTYYWKGGSDVLANPDGLITSNTGGGGWTIYQQGPWSEVWLMLNSQANPSYPRWQAQGLGAVTYLKTPEEGILSKYLTTQWCDSGFDGRICNEWEIQGYKTEADMLSMTNGTVLDHNTWSTRNRGESKIVELDNNKSFQYYTIQMLGRFGSDSYNSMGTTKFYMTTLEPVEHPETYYWKREYSSNLNGVLNDGATYNADTKRVTSTFRGYVTLHQEPNLNSADSWEIQVKAKPSSRVSGAGCLVSSPTGYAPIRLVDEQGRLSLQMRDTNNTEIIKTGLGSVDMIEVTIRIGYNSTSGYYADVKKEGETDFTRVFTSSTTTKVGSSYPIWFLNGPNQAGCRYVGDLYMDETYIKINGEEWWRGVEVIPVPATPDDYDYTTTNYDFTTETHVYKALKETKTYYWKYQYGTEINGNKYGDGSYNPDTRVLSTRNGNWGYIVTEEIPPLMDAGSWEIGTKFVYQGGVSIIGSSGGMWTNPWLSVQNGRMTISLSTYGETLAEGTWIDPPYYPSAGDLYEIKIGFTGDLYYVDYRRNGEGDFIRGWSRSSTNKVYNSDPLWFLHGPDNSGYRGYADLYLKDTYVTIDKKEWWRGVPVTVVPGTPDDYDFTT